MSPSSRSQRPAIAASAVLLALACAACESAHGVNFAPNEPPTVAITSGPIDTASAPQSWLVDIQWNGIDPDGRIDHYEYAIDPPSAKQARFAQAETAWTKTTANHVVARFHASHPDSLGLGATASEFHVFALRAFDVRGGVSALVVRAFYAYTVAPDVQITRPIPSALLTPPFPIPFLAEWSGNDPDGIPDGAGRRRPAFYRSRLLNFQDAGDRPFLNDLDSLLHVAIASDWAGWKITPGESSGRVVQITEVQEPSSLMGLAVVAVDEAGATTPYLMADRNFLQFEHDQSGSTGPRIHIFSSLVDFTYPSGGYSLDPLREIPVQAGVGVPLEFHWDGVASPGRRIVSTRWLVDGDPDDETPRSDPSDLRQWSDPTPLPGSALFRLGVPGTHRLLIEEADDFGGKSLGIVRLDVFTPELTHDLLILDDTRLEVDKYLPGGCPGRYTTAWPSAAELDTFLYARGGVPWRCTQDPATGVLSSPGLLAGFTYDTLGTRLGLEHAAAGVPLATLARYRHVLWLVDARGAQSNQNFDQTIFPVTALFDMSGPGLFSGLAAYIGLGGKVWLAGGGGAYASLSTFNKRANDTSPLTVFTARDGELGLGRPMYDAAHVRSALAVTSTNAQFTRSPAAVGGWAGHGPDGTLSAPDYARLPASLSYRDPGRDPLPPTRLASQASSYYVTSSPVEFVLEPDRVTEDFGVPGAPHTEAALDTLYDATGALTIDRAPAMLYYHGRENAPFVFTGFDLWTWTRADCQALVDFVLGDIWKLPKSGQSASVRPAGAPLLRARPAPPRVSVRP